MQIKYYRLQNGDIRPCALSTTGIAYKIYPNPDYIIDKSEWRNFERTEKLMVGINIDKERSRQWIEHMYIDKCNLATNLRTMTASMPDKQRMQELLDTGVIITNPDTYEIRFLSRHPKVSNWYFYIKRIYKPAEELPPTHLYDTYEEASGNAVPVPPVPDNFEAILAQAPAECYDEVALLLNSLPDAGRLPLRWRGHDLIIQSKASGRERIEVLYHIPDDWRPIWHNYGDKRRMIDIYLDVQRYDCKKMTISDIQKLYPVPIKEDTFNDQLRMILGKPFQFYMRERRVAEAKAVKYACPNKTWSEINKEVGLATRSDHFRTIFQHETGITPEEWWQEHQYDLYEKSDYVIW